MLDREVALILYDRKDDTKKNLGEHFTACSLLKTQEIHHANYHLVFQCEARYALDYSFSSVASNQLKERNTICAISINKQSDSQQMNVLSISIKTYLQKLLYNFYLCYDVGPS